MIPVAKVTKLDGQTGVVKPGSKGILAIIAPSSSGVENQPFTYSKPRQTVTDFGYGPLTEFASYVMSASGNPVLLVKGTASTPGAYGTVAHSGAGTSVVTATIGEPIDNFVAMFTVVNGGVVGTSGVTYTYSLDGGLTVSAVQALGVANTIVIPDSGVTFSLGVGTLLSGQTETVVTTGPRMTTSDITVALEALRVTSQPWEFVLVSGHDATSTTVTLVDAWLASREAEGRFRGFILGARAKNSGESESAYLTALSTVFSSSASIRGCVAADGGDVVSTLPGRGIVQKRSASLALAGRLMKVAYGTDAAYVSDGPIPGFALSDLRGNPKNHDENNYPGLDAIRLVTLRTFDRKAGTYITNANVLSAPGSDYVWAQHIRTMNRACEIAFDVLTSQLSRGVNKSPKLGPNGEVYIAEEDAQRIELLVNQSLTELKSQVADLRYTLSRTDNIGANGPVVFNGDVQISALVYAKEFDINASFVRTISVQA